MSVSTKYPLTYVSFFNRNLGSFNFYGVAFFLPLELLPFFCKSSCESDLAKNVPLLILCTLFSGFKIYLNSVSVMHSSQFLSYRIF